MLRSILSSVPRDTDYPERTFTLIWLKSALNGTLYDHLAYEFHDEKNGAGEYIPIRSRAPSVRYGLCSIVVHDSIALLFSEGHFPTVQCDDKANKTLLADLIKDARIDDAMVEAAMRGSVGSICISLRVLDNRAFYSVLDTEYLTPKWQAMAPDTLESVTERYKIKGADLAAAGYNIEAKRLGEWFWFQRVWDADAETWFVPQPVVDAAAVDAQPPAIDTARTVAHGLGFVPMVWIKNLPGGNDIDGACTFRLAVETGIEIDYQLSQAGRGLKYSSDPTLLIKEPAQDGDIVKGAGNALIVSADGDAKMLEIGGTASAAVIEYVRELRALALETVHGNRASADKLSAAQSGRALELMNQGLIWLADRLRASYGEHGLLPLIRMTILASQKVPLSIFGAAPVSITMPERISLKWPRWYAPTADDRQADASTLVSLKNNGLMSRQTAVGALADAYDIEDTEAELTLIAADIAADDKRLIEVAAQTKAATTVPS